MCLDVDIIPVNLDELGSVPFIMYPSPATTTLNIHAPRLGVSGAIVQIRDSSGRLVHTSEIGSVASLDISGLARGTYLVKLISESEHSLFSRVILQ